MTTKMIRGNFTTDALYEQSMRERWRPLKPIRPRSTVRLHHMNASQESSRLPQAAVRTQPRLPRATRGLGPRPDPNRRVSRPRGTHTRSDVEDLASLPRLKVCRVGSPASGRPLITQFDSSCPDTLITASVVLELGLTAIPWRPGRPLAVRKRGTLIEINRFVQVYAEVLGFDADLGQYNFGIIPDNIRGFEGIEISVGSKIIDRLVDLGMPDETRAKIDPNYTQRQPVSSYSPSTRLFADENTIAQSLAQPQQRPSFFLQPTACQPSFFGASRETSVFASHHSSNDANPISTPRTSVCGSIPPPILPLDVNDVLPLTLEGPNWKTADGIQVPGHNMLQVDPSRFPYDGASVFPEVEIGSFSPPTVYPSIESQSPSGSLPYTFQNREQRLPSSSTCPDPLLFGTLPQQTTSTVTNLSPRRLSMNHWNMETCDETAPQLVPGTEANSRVISPAIPSIRLHHDSALANPEFGSVENPSIDPDLEFDPTGYGMM